MAAGVMTTIAGHFSASASVLCLSSSVVKLLISPLISNMEGDQIENSQQVY